MKYLDWNEEKNRQLKDTRGISFEEIAIIIQQNNNLLDIKEHPNQKKYPGQKIFIINVNNYAYLVPFAENEDKYFLKTIIPSRKATKKYLLKN